MEESPLRFSSCRGVSFEIKPHSDLFTISKPTFPTEGSESKRVWLPWSRGSSSRVAPSTIQKSLSKASSHFCDLDVGEDEEDVHDNSLAALEEGKAGKENADKQRALANYASKREQSSKPAPVGKQESRLSIILLDQGLFTVYKRLFVVCLTLNIVGLVLAATGQFPYARNKAALFSIANIFALTLCRSEAALRVIFWSAVKILGHSWVPIGIKTTTTSFLQSLGGIHSGCGVSSIAWLIYALVLTLKDRDNTSPEIIAVASTILGLICLSSLAAFPLVRHLHHNVFERIHRFSGWSALALLWAFVILTISYDPMTKSYSNHLGSRLVRRQEFWFTVAITVLIIIPWLSVRRVAVRVTSASGHAALIKFQGGIKAGILGRISPSPLSEWHAFGIISDGKSEHMMLAGAVGDFTKSLVTNPPSHLWVRQVHFAGLPYLVNMYDRVLLVATGSGICVFLSFLLQPCRANVRLLWVAKGIEQNFGSEIKGMVSGHHKDKVIVHDTAVHGRPNVSEMSVEVARKWGAEVVIVTSNPEGSRDVVNACKSVEIPAFGPIWDS
ncbi:hypothetical protein SAY87_030565 [Trapa incisa]|uniref:Adenylate-forming reductase n=1 Tax=Trapa incisa TaxID=236973 RepID=A0AAN7KTC4_9MYRT|nr:hypothetical protein SAY87_030565 [Trapa incisa]